MFSLMNPIKKALPTIAKLAAVRTMPTVIPLSHSFARYCSDCTKSTETSSSMAASDPSSAPKSIKLNIPGTTDNGDMMIIVFTCKVCNKRSARKMSKNAYNNGVVIIRCPGCNNLHLIADHLGYFDDESQTIESILAKKGEKVKRIDDQNVMEFLSKEDLK